MALKIPPLLLLVIVALLMWCVGYLLPTAPMLQAPWLALWLSAALIGAAFSLAGVLAFRRANTTVDPRTPAASATLVSGGVYRITRNPMYVGFGFFLLAWAVAINALSGLALLPFFILYMNRYQIVPEERMLENLFGDEYRAYKARVRRWL